MSLRYAVLGVLSSKPMTGYDMMRYFNESVGTLWPASPAQTYQELRRLEAEGLIVGSIAPRGRVAEKRIFELTPRGRQTLTIFAIQPYEYRVERDGFRLQFVYLDLVSYDIAREHLHAHIAHHRLQIEHLKARVDGIRNRRSALMQARLQNRPADVHETIVAYRSHALEAQIMVAQAEVAWAKKALVLVANLERARRATSGPGRSSLPVPATGRRKIRRATAARP